MIIGISIIILLSVVFLFFNPADSWGDTGKVLMAVAALMALSGITALSVRFTAADKVKRLSLGQCRISPEKFLKLRKKKDIPSFKGVYILHNRSKRKYYVGQAVNVPGRVTNHFTGKGNGDVYADWKYGNRFSIKMIPLKGSGKKDLNELERCTIKKYKAYSNGYNKTKGNS